MAAVTPQWQQDELGNWHCYSYWRHHYVCGISRDKAEAEKRWTEALKAAQA